MEFAFTFGRAYNLRDNFVVVEAATEDEAREIFVTARAAAGRLTDSQHRWAFCYPADHIPQLIEHHGITPVDIDTPIDWADAGNPVE